MATGFDAELNFELDFLITSIGALYGAFSTVTDAYPLSIGLVAIPSGSTEIFSRSIT